MCVLSYLWRLKIYALYAFTFGMCVNVLFSQDDMINDLEGHGLCGQNLVTSTSMHVTRAKFKQRYVRVFNIY